MKRANRREGSSRGGSSGIVAAWAVVVCLVGLPGVGGCGRGSVGTGGRAEAVLTEVVRAYAAHLRANRYQPPADEAEFKGVLKQAGDGILKRAGVNSVDQLLVSPRDSQPFVIPYGADAKRLLERGVIAHEKTGASGRRLVGYDLGYVQDLDEQAFKRLLPDH